MSELRYRSSDSTVLWTPGLPNQQAVAFIYELSLENGSIIESSRVSNTELPLTALEAGKSYVLDVWEECDGLWESEPSHLCFEGANSSFDIDVRAIDSLHNDGQCMVSSTLPNCRFGKKTTFFSIGPFVGLQFDFDIGLRMVVPWSLPDLQDDLSESRAKLDQILKAKVRQMHISNIFCFKSNVCAIHLYFSDDAL